MKQPLGFFDAKPYDRKVFEKMNTQYEYDIHFFKPHLTQETLKLAFGFPAICIFVNDYLDAQMIEKLYDNGTRIIALRCAGYNNINLKAAFGKIHIVRVPAYSPYAVAEHAMAMILTLNRKTHRAYSRTRDGNFTLDGFLGFDLHGKTAGVIGSGKIGRILMQILKGFGLNVLCYDPYPNPEFSKKMEIDYVSLEELYQKSDIISLNCPLTSETHHIINKNSISLMKDNVMIINTGRGHLIDTQSLIHGLKSGKVGYAGLDVYEEESEYFFEDFSQKILEDDVLARLLTFNNVLITSHQAFFTQEALENIATTTFQNLNDFFAGKKLVNEVCYRCDRDHCEKKKNGKCF